MAGETVIAMVGNLTADPELRYTQQGLPVVNGTIANTPRKFNRQTNDWEEGDAVFMRFSAWREMAEHVASSLTKGMRVIAQGRLVQRNYQDREGNNRSQMELEVDEIGPSLRFATAQVMRAQSSQRGGQQQHQQPQQMAPQQGPPQGYPAQQAPQQGPPQGPPQQGYPAPQQQVPQQAVQQPQQPQAPVQAAPQQQAQQMPTPQNPGWGASAFEDETPF